jgi:hypothetical protein
MRALPDAQSMKCPSGRICSDNDHVNASPVAKELHARAKRSWTGCLSVTDPRTQALADLYLYEGDLYCVAIAGFVPNIVARICAAGIIDEAQLRFIESSTAPEERSSVAGRFCVEQGWLAVEKLAEFNSEYLLAGLGAVLAIPKPVIRDQQGAVTNSFCSLPAAIDDLLVSVDMRNARSRSLWSSVVPDSGPRQTVLAVTEGLDPGPFVAPELGAFVTAVNGERSVDEVAAACGLTRAEASFIGAALVNEGVLTVVGTTGVAEGFHLVPEDCFNSDSQ